MMTAPLTIATRTIEAAARSVHVWPPASIRDNLPRWRVFFAAKAPVRPLSLDPAWLAALESGLDYKPYMIEASADGQIRGLLPLAYVSSFLFGRHLVGLPYVNYGGVLADNDAVARLLIARAVLLADELGVRYLELRHEKPVDHDAFRETRNDKVYARLNLPASSEELWSRLSAKVRNQVRKGQKSGLAVRWGGMELLDAFYRVFARNMRDLGTPVYGKSLFRSIFAEFPDRSEFCVVQAGPEPVAAGLLLHGWGVSEVPSASSLRSFNHTCANMLLYWSMLERAVQRGQKIFDFGRSTRDSATFRFKKQWAVDATNANWQFYVRGGSPRAVCKENPKFRFFIWAWQRLPVSLTRLLGPPIIRGVP